MKLLFAYIRKTLLHSKNYLFISIILMSVGISGLCAILTVSYSLSRSYDEYNDVCYGRYTALMYSQDKLDFETISEYIYDHGEYQRLGIGIIDDVPDGFTIGCMDQSARWLLGAQPTEGRYPETFDEIAVESEAASYYQISVGDHVKLDLYNKSGGYIDSREVEVTGIISNYTRYQYFSDYDNENLFCELLIGGDCSSLAEKFGEYDTVHLLVTDESRAARDKLKLFQRGNNARLQYNQQLDGESFVNELDTLTFVMLVTLFVAAAIMSAVCLIICISYTNRILSDRINRLRLIGAGHRFVSRYVISELLCIAALALVPIILIYFLLTGGIGAFIRQTEQYYEYSFPILQLISVFIGIIVLLLVCRINHAAVSLKRLPDCGKAYSSRSICRRNYNIHTKNFFVSWSIKSLAHYFLGYVGVVLVLSVFGGVTFYYNMLREYVDESLRPDFDDDYKLTSIDGNYITEFIIPYYTEYGIDNDLIDRFESVDEISEMIRLRSFFSLISEPRDNDRLAGCYENYRSVYEMASSHESYEYEASFLGIGDDESVYRASLNGFDSSYLSKLLFAIGVPEDELTGYTDGSKVLLLTDDPDTCPYKTGDRLCIRLYKRDSDNNKLVVSKAIEITPVITAVSKPPEGVILPQEISTRRFTVICGIDFFKNYELGDTSNYLYLRLNDSSDYEDTERIVKNIQYGSLGVMVDSLREVRGEQRAAAMSVTNVTFVLQLLIILLCVYLVMRITQNRYSEQTALWAVLRCQGIKKHHAYLQNFYENLLLAALSSASSYLLAVLFRLQELENTISDLIELIVIFISMMAILTLSAVLPIRRVFSGTICECLRSE